MKRKIKVFIFGSCVSRDPFTLDDNDELEVIGYFARQSFGSLASPGYVDEKLLCNISSNFQRRMVYYDMSKSFFSEVAKNKNEIDVLLVDLVDERFPLNLINGCIHTVSNEYRKAFVDGGMQSDMCLVSEYSDEKFEYWLKGIDRFFYHLSKLNLSGKVILNKIFFTNRVDSLDNECSALGKWDKNKIDRANKELSRMYDYFSEFIGVDQVLSYPDFLVYADSNHRWGLAPFHYNKECQKFQLSEISLKFLC